MNKFVKSLKNNEIPAANEVVFIIDENKNIQFKARLIIHEGEPILNEQNEIGIVNGDVCWRVLGGMNKPIGYGEEKVFPYWISRKDLRSIISEDDVCVVEKNETDRFDILDIERDA